jgi:ParB-like chromosome segregation protein Spo0J
MANLKIMEWDISKIIEYARNPRKNDHAVDQMASAIREFGFKIPVIIKSDGTLIDGHLRIKAAKKLGLKKVPAILGDDLTEAQIKAFRINVNRMAEIAEWDVELLKLEIEDLIELDYNIETIGMDDDYLKKLHINFDAEFIPNLPDENQEKNKSVDMTVIVECENMEQQQELFIELRDRGYKVK